MRLQDHDPGPNEWWESQYNSRYDRAQFQQNLLDVSGVLDEYHVPHWLGFGTLLGAVRDGDSCEGDTDVDLILLSTSKPKLEKALDDRAFRCMGLRTTRVLKKQIVTLDRNHCLVDLYLFHERNDRSDSMLWCEDYGIRKWRLAWPSTILMHGRLWKCPGDPCGYLEHLYGDWRTPRREHATH